MGPMKEGQLDHPIFKYPLVLDAISIPRHINIVPQEEYLDLLVAKAGGRIGK